MSKLDQIAEIVYRERVDYDASWKDLPEKGREPYFKRARMILDCLMKPNKAMVKAVMSIEQSECIGREGQEEIWVSLREPEAREAIRAALQAVKDGK